MNYFCNDTPQSNVYFSWVIFLPQSQLKILAKWLELLQDLICKAAYIQQKCLRRATMLDLTRVKTLFCLQKQTQHFLLIA